MLDKSNDIKSLHQQVISAIKSTDLMMDKRKFIPHVTLGRYRHSRNSFAGSIPLNVSFDVIIDEVVLYQSVLTVDGAEYQPIYRFPLDNFGDQYEHQSSGEFSSTEPKGFLVDEG